MAFISRFPKKTNENLQPARQNVRLASIIAKLKLQQQQQRRRQMFMQTINDNECCAGEKFLANSNNLPSQKEMLQFTINIDEFLWKCFHLDKKLFGQSS